MLYWFSILPGGERGLYWVVMEGGKVNQNGDKGGREGAVIQKARQCSGPLDQVIQGAVLPFLFNY